ncbi:hypothetical protein PUN28_013540 [Cardiocondyla obscurior]|uniref:DNA-PKcs N-terminal domain-containing protein n=1 Tax=Cardiocondyla obscurior TaxID=286306 RepID=A0AAW2F7M3_9HYME
MDSLQAVVKELKSAISRNDYRILKIIFDDDEVLKNASFEECEFSVCSIFDETNGLLTFLNDELSKNRNRITTSSDDALKAAFKFLKLFIEKCYTTSNFVRYICQIKNVCQKALIVTCHNFIKKNAYEAFIKLIKLLKNQNLELDKTINAFITHFHIVNEKGKNI